MRSVSSYSTLRRTLKTLTDLVVKGGRNRFQMENPYTTTTMAREGTILEPTLTRSGRSFFGQIQSRFFPETTAGKDRGRTKKKMVLPTVYIKMAIASQTEPNRMI